VAYLRVSKHYIHLPSLMLGGFEGLIFVGAMFAGAWIRFWGDSAAFEALGPLWIRSTVFSLVMLLSMLAMGVYQAQLNHGLSGVMLRTAVSFLFGALALAVIFYLFPALFLGRGIIAIAAAIAFFLLWLVRYFFIYKMRLELLRRRVLVLGAGARALNLQQRLLDDNDRQAFELIGFLPMQSESEQRISNEVCLQLQGRTLSEYALEMDVREIVIALDDRRRNIPIEQLLNCKLNGIDTLDVMSFFERETGRVIVDWLHPSWLVFSDGFQSSLLQRAAKRMCDFIASALLILVSWPFMLATVIAIKIEDGWNSEIFYRQERVGFQGRPFWVYKFRSMGKDAEKGGAQWARANDTRVTKVGRIIRKYRIDELAQLFNVLRGDMAIVGPRPERPVFVEHLCNVIPYYNERHRVKPGVTGWAQLCYPYGASDEDSKNKLEYDMYYAKNNSLFLDVLILMQTIEVIMFGKGQ